jgi:hypothetical protein
MISNEVLVLVARVTTCRNKLVPWEIKQLSDDGTFTCFKNLSILNRLRAFWMNRNYKKQVLAHKIYFSPAAIQERTQAQQRTAVQIQETR